MSLGTEQYRGEKSPLQNHVISQINDFASRLKTDGYYLLSKKTGNETADDYVQDFTYSCYLAIAGISLSTNPKKWDEYIERKKRKLDAGEFTQTERLDIEKEYLLFLSRTDYNHFEEYSQELIERQKGDQEMFLSINNIVADITIESVVNHVVYYEEVTFPDYKNVGIYYQIKIAELIGDSHALRNIINELTADLELDVLEEKRERMLKDRRYAIKAYFMQLNQIEIMRELILLKTFITDPTELSYIYLEIVKGYAEYQRSNSFNIVATSLLELLEDHTDYEAHHEYSLLENDTFTDDVNNINLIDNLQIRLSLDLEILSLDNVPDDLHARCFLANGHDNYSIPRLVGLSNKLDYWLQLIRIYAKRKDAVSAKYVYKRAKELLSRRFGNTSLYSIEKNSLLDELIKEYMSVSCELENAFRTEEFSDLTDLHTALRVYAEWIIQCANDRAFYTKTEESISYFPDILDHWEMNSFKNKQITTDDLDSEDIIKAIDKSHLNNQDMDSKLFLDQLRIDILHDILRLTALKENDHLCIQILNNADFPLKEKILFYYHYVCILYRTENFEYRIINTH